MADGAAGCVLEQRLPGADDGIATAQLAVEDRRMHGNGQLLIRVEQQGALALLADVADLAEAGRIVRQADAQPVAKATGRYLVRWWVVVGKIEGA